MSRLTRGHLLRAIVVLACALPLPSAAFKVGVLIWPPIHETITAEAIYTTMPGVNPLMVINIQSGVYNTDFSHQPDARFHFDNSTAGNGGFDGGFGILHGMLAQAVSEAAVCDANNQCITNPLFLNPQHSTYRDLAEDIVGTYLSLAANAGCLEEPACPTDGFVASAAYVQGEVLPILLEQDYPDPDDITVAGTPLEVPNFADTVAGVKQNLDTLLGSHCRPVWSFSTLCFDALEGMAPSDNDFQLLAGHLRILQYEYQAYFAWQHLGHAFHTTQDFFAHSNYVELASCRKGPPCDPAAQDGANLCDVNLGTPPLQVPVGAIPLPTDQNLAFSLAQFQTVFNAQSAQYTLNQRPKVFADDNFNHLQTGYFPCIPQAPAVAGFAYCHTPEPVAGAAPRPGMNKDEPANEPNEQNFPWARASAVRLSAALFGAFVASLPAAASFLNPNFPNFVAVAAYPSGAMPACSSPSHATLNLGSVAHAVGGPTLPRITPQLTLKPAAPPPIATPLTIAAMVRPVTMRVLPPITRPELIRPIPVPHIFVRVSPNRVFRPGEQATIVVNAFDAQTGAPLPGLPVVIGSIRGATAAPIALTVMPQTRQQCGNISGQAFCLNELGPIGGTVQPPLDRYPGGAGSFALSVVIPKLLVSLAGGPAIKPGSLSFTVVAVDAHTRQPVPSAAVFTAGRLLGPANRPITFRLNALAAFQPHGRVVERLAAGHGPILIVRAPGYSDELVHYAVSNAAP